MNGSSFSGRGGRLGRFIIAQKAKAALRHVRMLINGAWVDSLSGMTLTVENPAKRRLIATIPRGDAADVAGAVEAAARAFPAWSNVAPRDRGRLLLHVADKMEAEAEAEAEAEEIARPITLETGNALRTQARGEARLAADIFRYFGGLDGELKGETIPLGEHVVRSVLRHIRVRSKHELKERLTAFIADINSEPVVHTWRYKIDEAA